MGKKIRITRKQLREDEVASIWAHLLHWVYENWKSLCIGLAAILIVFMFQKALSTHSASNLASANMLLNAAQVEIQNGLFTEDSEARKKVFAEAEDKLNNILTSYKRSKPATEAIYQLGNLAYYRNEYDEAERYFREYLKAAKEPVEKAQAHIALGYTYENKFFWNQDSADRSLLDDAEQNFLDAEKLTAGTTEHYLAKLGRARVYDVQADKASRAKDLYKEIAEERKIDPPTRTSGDDPGNYYRRFLEQMEQSIHLFTLAETARLRLERLEAE